MKVDLPIQKFKITLTGPTKVGKTSLINRIIKNEFTEDNFPTIGVFHYNKVFNYEGDDYNLFFLDTAGQEKFDAINFPQIRDSDLIFFVYDVSQKDSFEDIKKRFTELSEKVLGAQKSILVGCKSDLFEYGQKNNFVSHESVKVFAKINHCEEIQVSSKNGEYIDELIKLTLYLLINTDNNSKEQYMDLNNVENEKKKGCC